jgi:hypothetical protein
LTGKLAKPIVVTEKQTLTGGDVLPGFRLPLRKLFSLLGENEWPPSYGLDSFSSLRSMSTVALISLGWMNPLLRITPLGSST